MPSINYIDILIIIILLYNTYKGYVYGFWVLLSRFVVLFASIIGAFILYQYVGDFLSRQFDLTPSLAYGIGFVSILLLIQIIGNMLAHTAIQCLPEKIREHTIIKVLGIAPGFIDGIITVIIFCFIFVIAPVPQSLRDSVTNSHLGGKAISSLSTLESFINNRFGGILNRAFATLTTHPNSDERVDLPFKPQNLSVNEAAEARMLELLNAERVKAGVQPLTLDLTIIPVARAHSMDMWQRQYFAHISPDGTTPADRMRNGNVNFIIAGENLALAQTVELAHRGLMNSPGHKRNILDPQFTRIGIGAIDGGIYGKMFTQNFAR